MLPINRNRFAELSSTLRTAQGQNIMALALKTTGLALASKDTCLPLVSRTSDFGLAMALASKITGLGLENAGLEPISAY